MIVVILACFFNFYCDVPQSVFLDSSDLLINHLEPSSLCSLALFEYEMVLTRC